MSANFVELNDINVSNFEDMPTPAEIHRRLPLSDKAFQSIKNGRKNLQNILNGNDKRLFIVVGPCSIHDMTAGLDYANRLKSLSDKVADCIEIVMRVYFEKPRTTVGWKGFINDPLMNDTFRIDMGMEKARQFLLQVAELGLPIGTEALDPIAPQYYGDLISWTAIGARTTESQTHREISSGLSTPVGFKNATNGDLSVAVNAILAASRSHSFLGVNEDGKVCIVRTKGNPLSHLVLRGGDSRPNYDSVSVARAVAALEKAKVSTNVVIDCSHANSHKRPEEQPLVMRDVIQQVCHNFQNQGSNNIVGLMLESNIEAGNQSIPADFDLSKLKYGCSVTDACIDWQTTENIICEAAEQIRKFIK